MTATGMHVNTDQKVIQWEENSTPLHPRGTLGNKQVLNHVYSMSVQSDILQEAESRQRRIIEANYDKLDIGNYVDNIDTLSVAEKNILATKLKTYTRIFSGGLGKLNIPPVHIELKEDAKPKKRRPFPIPQSQYQLMKDEAERLKDIGVLAWVDTKQPYTGNPDFASPSFPQPKKDTNQVRFLTGFEEINKCIVRRPFPLPKISDMLQKLRGFRWASAIDLSMGYYHIPLDEESQNICTTVLPWGKCKYLRLPMGISSAPDIFQQVMSDLLGDLEFVQVHIDDVLITSDGSMEDHLDKLSQVLKRLEDVGFRANLTKCHLFQANLDYLGYRITRKGVTAQPKKVQAIHNIQPPKTRKQLKRFIGMVNYHRDLWRKRSHILKPLNALASPTKPFKWTAECQTAFEEMKRVVSHETLLTFPDFNEEFHVYADASDYQLGAAIMQKGRPLAFYSRTLTAPQKAYTTGEQELLSIVEALKEFRNLLFGQRIVVHADHKNILYANLDNQRIIRWRCLVEEYGATFEHIAGSKNVVADALSRLETCSKPSVPEGTVMAMCLSRLDHDESLEEPPNHSFASLTDEELERFPMSPPLIATEQRKEKGFKQHLLKLHGNKVTTKVVEDVQLLMVNGKIAVPPSLTPRILEWYHDYLNHPGATRMHKTLEQLFWWPNMRTQAEHHVAHCKICQMCKKSNKKHGKLPQKDVEHSIPWNRVNVDLIGPLSCKANNGTFNLLALTMIDPATGWFEVTSVKDSKAETVAAAFDDTWLSRYPRPQFIGFDGGGENKGAFKETIINYGLGPGMKPTTTHNPQSNSIVERIHQVLNDMLRTMELEERELDPSKPFDESLNAAAYAIRCAYHTTLQATPAQLVFGRDMILPIAMRADWNAIQANRQAMIEHNNAVENSKRIEHVYAVGDKVTYKKHGILRKLATPRRGPYEVTHVYSNGTLRIQRGHINERVNIRHLTPFVDDS